MKELFSLVIDLLHSDACVVVPGLGGFVANRKAASVDARSGLFCPPSVQVVFNPKLNHNDGLLCQAWAARYRCSLVDAAKQVAVVVEDVKNTIAAKGSLCVPGFGTLRLHGRDYSFVSAIAQQGFSEGFGLQEFRLPTLKSNHRRTDGQLKKLVGAGVAAAALAAVLLVPSYNQSAFQNMASLLPLSFNNTQTKFALSAVSKNAARVSEAAAAIEEPVQESVEVAPATEDGRFYVVLKSFATTSEAEQFVEQWQPRLSDKLAVVPVTEGFVTVACANTQNPELANKMMENVRKNSSFKDTFILYM
ncbi:MAG: hypothetical protein II623_04090 [Paludibacteraceae bacterium]|nr:hypothetical protein [Paludibacteraceae bacterium]